MVINMKNQEWNGSENFLIEENKGKNKGLVNKLFDLYKTGILNKSKRYYKKIKSKMEEPMFPF